MARSSATVLAPGKVAIHFPAPVAGLDRLFDQVAIVSSQSPKKEMAVLGPYYVSDYKPGSYVYLRKNPNYWKRDSSGRQLPYISAIKLEIQSNRDIEMMKIQPRRNPPHQHHGCRLFRPAFHLVARHGA